jgi:hypothetical protein
MDPAVDGQTRVHQAERGGEPALLRTALRRRKLCSPWLVAGTPSARTGLCGGTRSQSRDQGRHRGSSRDGGYSRSVAIIGREDRLTRRRGRPGVTRRPHRRAPYDVSGGHHRSGGGLSKIRAGTPASASASGGRSGKSDWRRSGQRAPFLLSLRQDDRNGDLGGAASPVPCDRISTAINGRPRSNRARAQVDRPVRSFFADRCKK